jgi:hypothetical protein
MHHAQKARKEKLEQVQTWLSTSTVDETIKLCMGQWSCTRKKAREYIRDVT